ncbi:DUF2680 domain-containing protein [Clostridium sp. AWRP]|uniref:DUF2680 domain-containing protein n=1 Tax=Clostridium sp. AWRP TaxID=2212991 RepID=UPI000FD90AD0|nr:DUF2680 domain-containing protein [Clostridium sp. AWRP]AZV58687.1 DUF2680 domain-containing protein [Clostridium sp. AWRP]
MKNFKKFVAALTIVGAIGSASAVYAATSKTPAEVVSGLTGKTVEDLYKEHTAGKTFGTIANEAGKLEEFKTQMLDQKKAVLDQRVKDGNITQEKADEIYNAVKTNQAACDGTGSEQVGKKYGAGFGQGSGMGHGMGKGAGMGNGMGAGRGMNK